MHPGMQASARWQSLPIPVLRTPFKTGTSSADVSPRMQTSSSFQASIGTLSSSRHSVQTPPSILLHPNWMPPDLPTVLLRQPLRHADCRFYASYVVLKLSQKQPVFSDPFTVQEYVRHPCPLIEIKRKKLESLSRSRNLNE